MNNQNPKFKDQHPALSLAEYLWLEQEKERLMQMNADIVRIQYRQDRQAGWIILLLICVIMLSVAVIALSLF